MIFAEIPVLQPLIDLSEIILKFFHDSVGVGWGLSIILMTCTIRLAILPLTFKGVKGMQEMQSLQPEMKKLQERYKDDKQRLQQETMAMYKEHGVNPLASCFPLLLQIPFFLALFYLLNGSEFKADIAADPSFLFIPDLAANPQGAVQYGLVVLYVLTQLGSSLVSTATADPMQRRIFMALPLVFGIFILISPFPSGLLVYWITTNLWTVGQQLVVRKIYPKPEPVDLPDPDSKPARGKPAGAATSGSGNGSGASPAKAPPGNPRKRKKRSGRRR